MQRDAAGTGALSEDRYAISVATERRDVVTHPHQRLPLVVQTHITSVVVILRRQET